MTRRRLVGIIGGAVVLGACIGTYVMATDDSHDGTVAGKELPTGKTITPAAARGAFFQDLNPGHQALPAQRAQQAAAISVSPDGKLAAILTSGFNRHFGKDGKPVPELSTEYVFLFDMTTPQPKQIQVLPIPNSFQGLAWAPSGDRFYASGGKDDDVLEFVRSASRFAAGRTFRLGHHEGIGLKARWGSSDINVEAVAGALAVSPDGTRLLATNFQNDSVSLIDLRSGQVATEQDLRPGIIDPKRHGQPGGSFPRCAIWVSPNHAYIGSERDREIVSLTIS